MSKNTDFDSRFNFPRPDHAPRGKTPPKLRESRQNQRNLTKRSISGPSIQKFHYTTNDAEFRENTIAETIIATIGRSAGLASGAVVCSVYITMYLKPTHTLS